MFTYGYVGTVEDARIANSILRALDDDIGGGDSMSRCASVTGEHPATHCFMDITTEPGRRSSPGQKLWRRLDGILADSFDDKEHAAEKLRDFCQAEYSVRFTHLDPPTLQECQYFIAEFLMCYIQHKNSDEILIEKGLRRIQ